MSGAAWATGASMCQRADSEDSADQALAQFSIRDRLQQIGENPKLISLSRGWLAPGEQDEAHCAVTAIRDDLARKAEAVASRHHVIEDREIKGLLRTRRDAKLRDCRFSAIDAVGLDAELRKLQAKHLSVGRIVVNDERPAIFEHVGIKELGFPFGSRSAESRGKPEHRP